MKRLHLDFGSVDYKLVANIALDEFLLLFQLAPYAGDFLRDLFVHCHEKEGPAEAGPCLR